MSYARQEDGDALPDGDSGYVSVFDLSGNFLQRLVSETGLNEPWGLALAPGNFGEFSNAVLVATTLEFQGASAQQAKAPLAAPGGPQNAVGANGFFGAGVGNPSS